MNTIETTQAIRIDESFKPYAAAFDAVERAGLDAGKVARYCESYLASDCTDSNRKVKASSKAVSVKWAPKKEGGKTTVKVAGATYELPDSAPGRFVQVLNHLEGLAEMYCPVDDMRLADSILGHFRAVGGLEKAKSASKATEAVKA